MEAKVWSGTGLLPESLEIVVLRNLDDGRWQARCQFGGGGTRAYEFDQGEEAERRIAGTLQEDLGFTPWCAEETARRLLEPFVLGADWA